MSEFWETYFQENKTTWGFEPCDSALLAANLFKEKNYRTVFIPGIGYGRNAKPFLDLSMVVAGVEISQTAVSVLNEHYPMVKAYCMSILDMPFEKSVYDGIFSYALIHLFNYWERRKVIRNCYDQIADGGTMIFSVVSDKSETAKAGKQIGKNRRLMPNGLKLFTYNDEFIRKEFEDLGLIEIIDINEPIKFMKNEPPMKFKMIICEKKKTQ